MGNSHIHEDPKDSAAASVRETFGTEGNRSRRALEFGSESVWLTGSGGRAEHTWQARSCWAPGRGRLADRPLPEARLPHLVQVGLLRRRPDALPGAGLSTRTSQARRGRLPGSSWVFYFSINYQLEVTIPKRQLRQGKALVPCNTHRTRTRPRTREGPRRSCGHHGIRSSASELPSPTYHGVHILLVTRGVDTRLQSLTSHTRTVCVPRHLHATRHLRTQAPRAGNTGS